MARTPKPLDPFDQAVHQVLRGLVDEAGATYRPLVEASGVGLNRLGIILRGEEPPVTIGELDRIGRALGKSASEILHAAEVIVSASDTAVRMARLRPIRSRARQKRQE